MGREGGYEEADGCVAESSFGGDSCARFSAFRE